MCVNRTIHSQHVKRIQNTKLIPGLLVNSGAIMVLVAKML